MSTTQTLEVPGFQVLKFLGNGACSTIWRVRDRQSGELFALKRVERRSISDLRFIEQAQAEYDVASGLDHPAIRHVYRLRKIRRMFRLREVHLVMELCEGQTVQDNRPASLTETLRIFEAVADGLAYVNSQGFIHADMKPNNIIVAPDGTVKVIDFGQSCRVGTVKERIQGTPDFIAPEQVRRQPLDVRTDVFNFGAALYWTVTGRAIPTILPKENEMMLMADLVVTPPEKLNTDVPLALSKLIMECIEMQPAKRPATMSLVASRLGLAAHKVAMDMRKNGAQAAGK